MLLLDNFMSFVLVQLLLTSTIMFVSCETSSPYLVFKNCEEKEGLFGDNPQVRMYGTCENYIASPEKCREEIERLKLRFVNKDDFQDANMQALGLVSSSSNRPPACYGHDANFYFNTNRQSPEICGHEGRMCICQEPTCQPCPKESYSYGGLNARCIPCPKESDETRNYPKIVEQCKEFWKNPRVGL